MGANSLIYNSILNIGRPSTWNVDKCIGSYCPNFFRHPLLDMWNKLPIDEVKLVLYKNQAVVVTMVFDGRNTNLENWFSVENLRSSPWNDLSSLSYGQSTPWNDKTSGRIFSMKGFIDLRRFYTSSSHGGCNVDKGWLTVNEVFDECEWEKSDHFPRILYSEIKEATVWHDGYGVADSMAIFIRLRQN
eukprot:XP_014787879.1 PREDICTED: uncharacterized protein LOC106881875 isoform X2 [Octopus bimaculoides]